MEKSVFVALLLSCLPGLHACAAHRAPFHARLADDDSPGDSAQDESEEADGIDDEWRADDVEEQD